MSEQAVLMETQNTDIIQVSRKCVFRDEANVRVVLVSGIPVFRYDVDDKFTEKFVLVSLAEDGFAKQTDLANSFGYGVATIRRWQRKYDEHGIDSLRRKTGYSSLSKMGGAKDRAVREMFQQGESNGSMARRLGVTEGTIRYTLKRLGLERPKPESQPLEFEEETSECKEKTAAAVKAVSRDSGRADSDAASEVSSDDAADAGSPAVDRAEHATECSDESVMTGAAAEEKGADAVVFSLDDDPTDRQCDRALARLGLLQDAAPMFAPGKRIPGAGVLLAVPLIVSSGALGVL